jgi:hypothetical protein
LTGPAVDEVSGGGQSLDPEGAGCNTRGVCHQLSSGLELKYDRLRGDEDVKVKPMEASSNLNLDVAPLLYI